MSERIILDAASFKVLSSKMKVSILKALDKRKMTLTDLSTTLNITKPGLLKHIGELVEAGLVLKEEKKRKWIYYELSFKGRRILHPETVIVTILLSSAIISLIIAVLSFVFYMLDEGVPTLISYFCGGWRKPPILSNIGASALSLGTVWLYIAGLFLIIFVILEISIIFIKKKYRTN